LTKIDRTVTADIALGEAFMASQLNDAYDLQGLLKEVQGLDDEVGGLIRQLEDIEEAHKSDEAVPVRFRFNQVVETFHRKKDTLSRRIPDLRQQIGGLRKATKFAEAVPLAKRLIQVLAAVRTHPLEVVEPLIDLAELLIAVDRPAEAEPLLQRAFAIIAQDHHGEIALQERFSHMDTGRLVQAVQSLRDLLAYRHEVARRAPQRRYLREPMGRSRSEAEADRRFREELRVLVETIGVGAPRQDVGRAAARERPEVMASSIPTHPSQLPARQSQQLLRRPDPSTPEGALSIEAGRLAYQIPNRMWVGVQETVEVRLGAVIATEIMQGFVGRGDVKLEHVPIVETMSVSLVCQPGTFDIESRSKETQLVKPDLVKGTAFHQEDFARWIWLVTPRQRGKHTLLVKVSAAIRDSRGLPTTSSLPDKIIAVTVRVHLFRATVGAIRYIVPLILSGVITALVGVFTKDYWWPAVRSWLGW
jgi:hypothetical protein